MCHLQWRIMYLLKNSSQPCTLRVLDLRTPSDQATRTAYVELSPVRPPSHEVTWAQHKPLYDASGTLGPSMSRAREHKQAA